MFKLSQKGFAPIFVVLALLAAVALGTYLVQTKTNLLPRAQMPEKSPETSFALEPSYTLLEPVLPLESVTEGASLPVSDQYFKSGSSGGNIVTSGEKAKTSFNVYEKFRVNLFVRSDIEPSNLFAAKITFPKDLLEVILIETNSQNPKSCKYNTDCGQGYLCQGKGLKSCNEGSSDCPASGGVCMPIPDSDFTCGGIAGKRCPGGYVCSGDTSTDQMGKCVKSNGTICAAVITRACRFAKPPSKMADICQDFPTPCDVPPNWTKVDQDNKPIAIEKEVPIPILEKQNPLDYFIQNWVEQKYDNSVGTISLVGGVPSPGIKTEANGQQAKMATIVFKAKKSGAAVLGFEKGSGIYRNSDNQNILQTEHTTTINIQDRKEPPSEPNGPVIVTPTPSPSDNPPTYQKGDGNRDGKIDLSDLSSMLSNFNGSSKDHPELDMDGNGSINTADFGSLVKIILGIK